MLWGGQTAPFGVEVTAFAYVAMGIAEIGGVLFINQRAYGASLWLQAGSWPCAKPAFERQPKQPTHIPTKIPSSRNITSSLAAVYGASFLDCNAIEKSTCDRQLSGSMGTKRPMLRAGGSGCTTPDQLVSGL